MLVLSCCHGSWRNLDLCEAFNTGYLLRLSIIPDVGSLDEGIAKEFSPKVHGLVHLDDLVCFSREIMETCTRFLKTHVVRNPAH